MDSEKPITKKQLFEAEQVYRKAESYYFMLQNQYGKQQRRKAVEGEEGSEPETAEEWHDTRKDKLDRSEQAEVRLYYVNFPDPDHQDRVRDFYPLSDGTVAEMDWLKLKRPIPETRKALYAQAVAPFLHLSDREKQEKRLAAPCATETCDGATLHTVENLEIAVEKNFEHELNADFYCAKCSGLADARLDAWRAVCPRIFREGETATDRRFFPPSAWKAMQRWGENIMQSSRSLYVYGASGVCKSRMMFEILRDYVVENALTFKVFAGGEYRQEQERIMSTRFDRKGDRFTSNAASVDVLVFDDFAQDDLMPSMKSDLRLLIDQRLANGLRTIFLANVAPDGLGLVFGNDFGTNSLKRRILDFCDVVEVRVSKQALDASIRKERANQ